MSSPDWFIVAQNNASATTLPLTVTYSLGLGNVGTAYSGAFTAAGGVGPYTFAITSGSLPPGLSLTTSGANAGQISGTPTSAATVPFVCVATDSASHTATITGSITILPTGVGPFTDVVTGLTITVVYRATGNGNYEFQAQGSYTIPAPVLADTSFSFVTAGIYGHGVSPATGQGWLLGNIPPPTHAWLGAWIDVPAASTQYDIYAWCVSIYNTQSTASATATITVSIALAMAYLSSGGVVVVGAEIPNGTLTGVQVQYNLTADGGEGYVVVGAGTVAADPRVAAEQLILCPIALIAGYNGTVGGTIPASGSPLNVYVSPYSIAGSCTVASDGITVTAITPGVAPGLAGNFTIIAGVIYQVASWVSASSVLLLAGSAAPSGTSSWYSIECRYGMSPGDIIQIDNEQFTLVGPQAGYLLDEVVEVGGTGVSAWVLARITGQTWVSHTTGSGKLATDVSSAAGNVDAYAGSMLPGTTQSVSPLYPMGTPTAYIAFLVAVSTLNKLNTWPVFGGAGATPYYIVGAIEAQTPGTLSASRLASTELVGFSGGSGFPLGPGNPNSANLVFNGNFNGLPLGQNWLFAFASVVATGAAPTPHSGLYVCEMTPPGASGTGSVLQGELPTQPIPCEPGDVYTMTWWVTKNGSPNGTLVGRINYFLNGAYSGSMVSTPTITTVTASAWTQYNLTVTVPAGCNQIVPTPAVWTGGTTGFYYVDDVVLTKVPATAGPVTVDALGNLNIGAASILQSHIANLAIGNAQLQVLAVQAGNLASGAAASNINLVANSLNANTIIAPNAVITQLIAGTVTASISFTAPTIVASKGTSLITLNSGAFALAVSNTATGNTIDLTNGEAYCSSSGGGFSESATLQPGDCTVITTETSTGESWTCEMDASSGSALIQASESTSSNSVSLSVSSAEAVLLVSGNGGNYIKAQATSAGSWMATVSDALDASAPQGSITYYSGHFYAKNASGWVETL